MFCDVEPKRKALAAANAELSAAQNKLSKIKAKIKVQGMRWMPEFYISTCTYMYAFHDMHSMIGCVGMYIYFLCVCVYFCTYSMMGVWICVHVYSMMGECVYVY